MEFIKLLYQAHTNSANLPSRIAVSEFIDGVLSFLFPEHALQLIKSEKQLIDLKQNLEIKLISILNEISNNQSTQNLNISKFFFNELPNIYDSMLSDAEAITLGDPAATDVHEVIRSYPGFYAIAVYRISHLFYIENVKYLPRVLSEYAHAKTGIDINPGAKIGMSFFIDHGTGVVIGETAEVGNRVKIYQGVTLGALSVEKTMAKTKRHPTIEDDVIIYSGATILGGETTVGKGSVIGGNVWLVKSVPEKSKVYYKENVPLLR